MSELGRISGQLLKENLLRQSNLNFKNRVSDTALLHLDVIGRKIGVNTESPSDAVEVPTIASTDFISPYANINNISIQYITANNTVTGNEIVSNVGNLCFNAANQISASEIATDDININNRTISTYTTDTNLELRPNGTGDLNIRKNTNITGNLFATGDIRIDTGFVVGDNSEDTVKFDADINSDIIPDESNVYRLGNPSNRWQNLYSNLLNGERIEVSSVSVSDVSLSRRQGNIFYVSTLGDDTNVGDHQHGAFRTLKHALEVVDASSQGPVTIHIYPGVYEEQLPLTVPERVTVSGEDIRNTVIKPAVGYETDDVFLLNQNSTVENITIKDFYSPGYAFQFENDALIVERSPYVRNVSVITKGSVTSATDPRGFEAGDAGQGAYIDGNVLDIASTSFSMLFHSCTFITPGVDCITMTNGVRVEWLNCFTYFANRGLYCINPLIALDNGFSNNLLYLEDYDGGDSFTESIDTLDGDDVVSSPRIELRAIGSANVYGNFGAVANGENIIMYLISHNFAYIGAGKDVSNDRTLTLQDQETQELNQGKIYYTSTDADGTFRVGDAFFVDFEKGTTNIDIDAVDFTGVSSIIINDGGDITFIDGERIDIGNLRFSGNTIFSLDGDIIFKSASLETLFDTNPGFQIAKGTTAERKQEESDFRYNTDTNLFEGFSSSNVGFAGVYSDDQQTFITANNTEGDLVFTADNIETVRVSGNNRNLHDSSLGQYGNIQLNGVYNGNILIDNNSITTTESNSDIEFVPNGASYTQLENIAIYSNVIENFEDTNLSLFVTDQGYVKFDTTGGFVIPFGNDATRTALPEVGDTRYNTDKDYLEVWNGDEWQRAAGTGDEVTEDSFEDIMNIFTLVLG